MICCAVQEEDVEMTAHADIQAHDLEQLSVWLAVSTAQHRTYKTWLMLRKQNGNGDVTGHDLEINYASQGVDHQLVVSFLSLL